MTHRKDRRQEQPAHPAASLKYAALIFDKKTADKSFQDFHKWLNEAIGEARKVTVKTGETTGVKFVLP